MSTTATAGQRRYGYKIRTTDGKVKSNSIQAQNRDQAIRNLLKQPEVGSVLAVRDIAAKRINANSRPKQENLIAFIEQLGMGLSVGLSKEQSLVLASKGLDRSDFVLSFGVAEVSREVDEGSPISDAMRKHPNIFPRTLVETIATGESSGELKEAVTRASGDLSVQGGQMSKIKHSLKGPMVNLVLVLSIFAALMIGVIPKFVESLETLGGGAESLPGITKAVMAVSAQMWWSAPLVAGLCGAAWFIYRQNATKPKVVAFVDEWKLKVPVFGNLFSKVALSRFCFTYTSLAEAKMATPEVLRITAAAAGNNVYSNKILEARTDVIKGSSMIPAFAADEKLFPTILTATMELIENTGRTGDSLRKLGEGYNREVDQLADNVGDALKPFFTILTGGLVAIIGLAMILPYISMADMVTPY